MLILLKENAILLIEIRPEGARPRDEFSATPPADGQARHPPPNLIFNIQQEIFNVKVKTPDTRRPPSEYP